MAVLGAAYVLWVTADGVERVASQLSQALERQLEEQFYAALRRPDEERTAFTPLQAQI
jgi:GTP cyclohydrolase FolE2